VAEVSWLTPTTSLGVAFSPLGTPGHHWSAVACGGTSIGHKCLAVAAKTMAASCLDFLAQPETIQKMRDEWSARKKGREYKSPLPPDLQPRVVPRKEGKTG
jgi:aminobenzoyl-glutamate utilization protein B